MNASCSSSREIVRTRTPRFGTNETSPSAASRRNASRTGVRDTLNCSETVLAKDGPGASSPETDRLLDHERDVVSALVVSSVIQAECTPEA